MEVAEQFNLIENFVEGEQEATIRVNESISNDSSIGITGSMFSSQFDYLVSVGVKHNTVLINSSGGNMFNGLEIFSTIKDSPVKTTTKVVGLAASIAGIISQAGDERIIKDYAIFHAHPPQQKDGKTANNNVIQLASNSLKTILSERSSLSDEEIEVTLSKESFFSASEAKDAGFFDIIESGSSKGIEITENMNEFQIMNLFNSIEQVKPKKNKKMKDLNVMLGLSNEASETSQVEAINSLKELANESESLKTKNEELELKVEELNNNLNDSNKEKAVSLIENAIALGKIDIEDKESKDSWIGFATKDYAVAEKMINGIKTVVASANIVETIENNNSESRKIGDLKNGHKTTLKD